MNNILFMLDHYTPNASPNGLCVEKVASELVRNGWNVSILCFGSKDIDNYEIDNGINIYRACDLGETKANSKIDAIQFYSKWLLPSNYPITERKDITAQLYEYGRKLHEEIHFDIIVCVHLPIETLIAGVLLKNSFPEITIVSYMLDSLSGGFIPRFLPEFFTRKRKRIWEKRLFNQFDLIILMESSRALHEKFSFKERWYEKARYLDIPLLVSRKKTEKEPALKSDSIKVVFCGLLNYPFRNIKYFIRIAEKCSPKYHFIFAGKSNIENELKTQNGIIDYLGQLPHSEVELLLEDADALLNLGVTVPSAISGKIFEYMSYGKPIISTYSIENEACIPYLQRYPLGLLIDERNPDVTRQAMILQEFISSNIDKKISSDYIFTQFYNNTPKAFENLLIELQKTKV